MTPKNRAPNDEEPGGHTPLLDQLRRAGLDDTEAQEPPEAAAEQAAPAASRGGRHRMSSRDLTAESVLKPRAVAPTVGWRRAMYALTGGRVNFGPSKAEQGQRALEARAQAPIPGCHRIAVISLKGGVGKTTTTSGLGATFATLRTDRVVAIDANPDRGTLGEKVAGSAPATVRDLLRDRERLTRYTDVRAFTAQSPTRLEVLASDTDPAASQAFSEEDYRGAQEVLERYYSLILTDCGTGLLHNAMRGVLGLADSIVVVSSASLDGARSASATLDWLDAHGYDSLVEHAVAVISAVRPNSSAVDLGKLSEHFATRCRAVEVVPYDPHLEAGAVVDLDQLKAATRQAYLKLAASVADGFATASGRAGS